jgi:hypothetical protein
VAPAAAGPNDGASSAATPSQPDPTALAAGAHSTAGQSAGGSPASAGQSAANSKTWWATVEADRAYYDRFSAGGPVDFPDQPPPSQSIPLLAAKVALGRRSRSRGTSPEIDLSGPPEDPAVSHAHASLIRQPDGSFSLLDAGSTNGTRVNDEEDPVALDVPRPLVSGDRIYLGAWSRVTLEERP